MNSNEVSQVGYICKKCGGPSPVGVGFVDNNPSAEMVKANARINKCECGYSRIASPVSVDISEWPRGREVVEYAAERGIGIAEAINELVNSGLSHR